MASQKNVEKVFHLLLTGMWLVPPKPDRQVPVCRSESCPRAWQEGRGGMDGRFINSLQTANLRV